MGPFSHRVDHGLDNRIIAYGCMTLLIDYVQKYNLELGGYLGTVVKGLSDHAAEIRISALLIIQRLCNSPNNDYLFHLEKVVPLIIPPLQKILATTLKSSASKQDMLGHADLMTTALRTLFLLGESIGNVELDEIVVSSCASNSAVEPYVSMISHQDMKRQ